jgi:hypothetical protein
MIWTLSRAQANATHGVIPAKAGISVWWPASKQTEIPAFAGMTAEGLSRPAAPYLSATAFKFASPSSNCFPTSLSMLTKMVISLAM